MLTFKAALDKLEALKAFPADLDTAGRKARLNEVCERLIDDIRFVGSQNTININVGTTGVLTLPRHFSTMLGVLEDGVAVSMASKWWTYAQGVTQDLQQYSRKPQPLGTGFVTFADPTEPVKLQITSNILADSALSARVEGPNEDGNANFSDDGSRGIDVPLDGTTTTKYFAKLDGLVLPVTRGFVTITAVYDDTSTEVIGLYEPGETNPDYTRYLIGSAQLNEEDDPMAVTALCQRQYVEMVSDYDIVYPSHIGALKHGCLAVHFEGEGEEERFAFHFKEAISRLNAKLRRSRPESEVGAIRIRTTGNPIGAGLRSTY